jgi:membrane associated rhomboid family serine protease
MPRDSHDGYVQYGLPRPGRALKGVMLLLFSIWLVFAIGLNWAGLPAASFDFFVGNNEQIWGGQLWRFFTAPLLHLPIGSQGVWHMLMTLLGLFFLAPQLEESMGGARFLRFLAIAALTGYVLQFLVTAALPSSMSQRLVGPIWFGAMPALEGVAIAWALSFRGQTVRLMFVIPVSSRGLIIFVVAVSVLYLIAGADQPSGLVAPFGGMLVGWLLGGGTPSPLRRFWLKFRYKKLEREAERARSTRRDRVARSGLRVIEGGGPDQPNDPPPNGNGKGKRDGVGPDGRLLN